MGIIVSSFPGCGKSYLTNIYRDKIKILDAGNEFPVENEDYESFSDKVLNIVDDYDIVFIPAEKQFINSFNKKKIDYDLFYPSKERRGEFIENCVRKRVPSHDIMMLDRHFNKRVDEFDEIESENCYKHKLMKNGEYLGNDTSVMQYINNVQENREIK